ncbi:butyrophilin subfamily 1 member A1-like [Symphorus nematophorus]
MSSCGQSEDQQNIRGLRGQSVTLQCKTPTAGAIIAAEWSRPDVEPLYVFFYRNKQPDLTNQHQSYSKRAELADSQLKGGNLSLILKDLQVKDTGTYQCRVKQDPTKRLKRAIISSDPICSINLTVTESSLQMKAFGRNAAGGSMVGHVGLLAGVLLLVMQQI